MKRNSVYALVVAALLLVGCNDQSRPAPGGGTPPPPSGRVVDCSEFKEFYEVFQEMKKFESSIAGQTTKFDRLAWASALLASHLSSRYSIPRELVSSNREAQAYYLKYFGWTFSENGYVREKPTHPLTRECL